MKVTLSSPLLPGRDAPRHHPWIHPGCGCRTLTATGSDVSLEAPVVPISPGILHPRGAGGA